MPLSPTNTPINPTLQASVVQDVKDTFPEVEELSALNEDGTRFFSDASIYQATLRASQVLDFDCLDTDVNQDYIRALYAAHVAEYTSITKRTGVKKVKNAENENSEVEFHLDKSESSIDWTERAMKTPKGIILLEYFADCMAIASMGSTTSTQLRR